MLQYGISTPILGFGQSLQGVSGVLMIALLNVLLCFFMGALTDVPTLPYPSSSFFRLSLVEALFPSLSRPLLRPLHRLHSSRFFPTLTPLSLSRTPSLTLCISICPSLDTLIYLTSETSFLSLYP